MSFYDVLAEEEEEKTSEKEDEQQLPALDSVKTGHRSVEKDSLSPGEDADSVGEIEMWK